MSSIAEKAIGVAVSYMGPVGQRFLERQTMSHMNGLPLGKLDKSHLSELAKWIQISAGLVMDANKASEFATKVKGLV
jgi:hypothetical protein